MWDKIVKRPDHMSVWRAIGLIIRWRWYRIRGWIRARILIPILCRRLGWHRNKVVKESFERRAMVHEDFPHLRKYAVRHRLLVCKRCFEADEVEELRRVAKDLSYPERRFKR